ncbi:MAG TPA: preprotein translocase subunit YajC [Lachnospiraceae bacterium]|nr:preprotein translocase subunit YajC [Lachnospiraceae bacterium]
MNFGLLLEATEQASGLSGFFGKYGMIIMIVGLFVLMYFFMIRPSNKENKRKNDMLANMAVGDTVLTSSGFYGVIIDIGEDVVIVEFGSNKNCRIPMQKSAITSVEKPEDAEANAKAAQERKEAQAAKEEAKRKKKEEKEAKKANK